ncbi:LytR/AlgR family response regulator transcription factor [Tunicatimonas pelagia]|uniref:LytR/AlgR family response regulator transcription factor n=1 Tax=Tunicatimonas pelagia TaxID=931531 RepID=UPI0026658D22|nr:response regulator [Tunicatimonas pelagia]WKN44729.1 response regulator [Tunicatimonas pelagia]
MVLNCVIVEDNRYILEELAEYCQESGVAEVKLATINPVEALEYIQDKTLTVDLLLTDINMPLMSGFQLIKSVARSYDALSPKFGIITAYTHYTASDTPTTIAAFIYKPFTQADIITALENIREQLLATGRLRYAALGTSAYDCLMSIIQRQDVVEYLYETERFVFSHEDFAILCDKFTHFTLVYPNLLINPTYSNRVKGKL